MGESSMATLCSLEGKVVLITGAELIIDGGYTAC
jgi:hypothetical protein